LDDAHHASAVVIAGVVHVDESPGRALDRSDQTSEEEGDECLIQDEVRLHRVEEDALAVVALSALTSVQTRGSMPPRTAGKNRHTKPTVAASSDLTHREISR
jgi:hypothetical protein